MMMNKQDWENVFDGVLNWEWSGNASFEGLVNYAYWNCDSVDYFDADEKNAIIKNYLCDVGENPADYSL